jgi:hypothetical protein
MMFTQSLSPHKRSAYILQKACGYNPWSSFWIAAWTSSFWAETPRLAYRDIFNFEIGELGNFGIEANVQISEEQQIREHSISEFPNFPIPALLLPLYEGTS